MKNDMLKAVIAFLAGLIVTVAGVGYWAGHTLPTMDELNIVADKMNENIENLTNEVKTMNKLIDEMNYLMTAHDISWDALRRRDARDHRNELVSPNPADGRGGADGSDRLGSGDGG